MSAYTPAPWRIVDHLTETARVVGGEDGAQEVGTVWCTDFPDGAANARLIAAAPDLLAALEKVLGSATELGGLGGAYITVSGDTLRAARAAIAKAVRP